MIPVTIKRVNPELPLPAYSSAGACAFDLASRVDKTIEPGEISLLPSNLIIKVPAGYVLLIIPRSSLAKKKGLIMPHSLGVIDQDYCGPTDEILIQLQNITKAAVAVEAGERIAQGLIVPIVQAEWHEQAEVEATSRGGFGSTGGYQSESD